jgi:putative membrane protein
VKASGCGSVEHARKSIGLPPLKRAAFGFTLAIFAITWIAPVWPVEQALHSSLTVVGLIWLVLHDRHWPMRNGDFIAICAFIVVHCIAARWLYSNVPYDAWLRTATGWSPQAAFGWERNHFDRLIHLLFGLCFAPMLAAHARQRWTVSVTQGFALAVLWIMAVGLIYEWLEWAIALLLSPDQAEAYNGQQGDVWDAHKDMLLATLGALICWPWLDRQPQRTTKATHDA